MKPTLLSFGLGGREIAVHSYGVLVAVGFAAGIALAWRNARRAGFDPARVLDLSFWGLVVAIAGARLTYVAVNFTAFAEQCRHSPAGVGRWSLSGCLAPLRFWEGGLVFYGGLAAAAATAFLFARRERWHFGQLADLFAPSAALGHAIGRLGCFAAGCCFGKPTSVAWGVSFPAGSVAHEQLLAASSPLVTAAASGGVADRTPHLHPTQLYEGLGELMLFALLFTLQRRAWARGVARRPGQLFLVYAVGYAALRFAVELVRGDPGRHLIAAWKVPALAELVRVPADLPLMLSMSQLASVLVIGFGATVMARRRLEATRRAEERST